VSLRDEIAEVYVSPFFDDDAKRAAVHRIKTTALVAEIKRRLLDQPYTHLGHNYLIREVMAGPADQLVMAVEIDGTRHTVHIVNPPLLPREPSAYPPSEADERRDMRRAVREMLEGFGT